MKLTCVTYNIMYDHYQDMILENIREFIEVYRADILCFQEGLPIIKRQFETFFSQQYPDWQIIESEGPASRHGLRNMIAWNSARLRLLKQDILVFPIYEKARLSEWVVGSHAKGHRNALQATFSCEGKQVRMTTAHLAWEGGWANRKQELHLLADWLDKEETCPEILTGDFNTAPWQFPFTNEEGAVQKLLGETWENVLPKLPWTYDITYTDPANMLESLYRPMRRLGIHMHFRLDYLFARNLTPMNARMLDLPGSDHRPLMATFETAVSQELHQASS